MSIGALGDSYYEYLLKAAIQLNDQEARTMYDEAMDAFVNNDLVRVSRQNHLLYIAESRAGFAGSNQHKEVCGVISVCKIN